MIVDPLFVGNWFVALSHLRPYCNTAMGCSQMEQICIVPGNTMAANVSLCDESRGCTAAVKSITTC